MGLEVERKFCVRSDEWRSLGTPVLIRQGYLCEVPERVVRVRLADGQGWLTVKGINIGASRLEFEYEIPGKDAADLLQAFCIPPLLEKRRTRIPDGALTWEVDEFLGDNAGLIIAEIELPNADHPFPRPAWIGEEVTGDPRYYNSQLRMHPYSRWSPSHSP